MLAVTPLRRAVHAAGLVVGFVLALSLPGIAMAAQSVAIENQTGHNASAFLFADDRPHTSGTGGTALGTIANGESKSVDLSSCTYSIVLVDGSDVWHAEFHDCEAHRRTIFADSGRK
jgi:hypothetical protein